MKIRRHGSEDKIETQMAPMIDVVFQLLIFFMLTLKIVEPEGDFNINMPIGAPAQSTNQDIQLSDIKVRLIADPVTGVLSDLRLGQRSLGNGNDAFARLNGEILRIIGQPGNPLMKDQEVEIDADYDLNYEFIIKAVSSCTGRMENGKLIRYIEKIKFAAPRDPAA